MSAPLHPLAAQQLMAIANENLKRGDWDPTVNRDTAFIPPAIKKMLEGKDVSEQK